VTDLRAVDLSLLVVLDAVLEHRSVTRAAAVIGSSQLAVRAVLARLRKLFNDPLFVGDERELKPTACALHLAVPVRQLIDTVRCDTTQCSRFAPGVSDRRFVLLTPDAGEMHFVPALVGQLAELAPGVRLATFARRPEAAADALESGAADLALGYFPDLHEPDFVRQKLFDNSIVCLVRRRHSCTGARFTFEAYMAASHAVLKPDGRQHLFDQFIQHRRMQRRIVVELSDFFSLLPVLEGSDIVATVPRDMAEAATRYADLRIVELPLRAQLIPIHQTWHERVHRDPAHAWLRAVIYDLFASSRASAASA
jgi:DNA-binding transcriptional LysR family regulator